LPAAAIVTAVLVVIAIVVVARFLFLVATMLRQVSANLDEVIGAVSAIPERTAPIEPVLHSINHDLGAARDVLDSLLARKLAPSAPRASSGNGAAPVGVLSSPAPELPTSPTSPAPELPTGPTGTLAPPDDDDEGPILRWPPPRG
jgi:hypothetical protein